MNCLITIILYLLGMFVTFCGILIYIYFRPSETEEWGDVYPIVALLMVIMWPVTICATILNLIFTFFQYIFEICSDKLAKVIAYVAKKGESRQTQKRLTRNINKSRYYESKNSK